MRLTGFSYSELDGLPGHWKLHPMSLQKINLVVGRNASGKSRTLNVILGLAKCLSGQPPSDGHFLAEFEDDAASLKYELVVHDRQVRRETLTRDDDTLLDRREGGVGTIRAVGLGKVIKFQAPPHMLAANSRVDSIQHPFLEPLAQWAGRVYYYPCHTELGKGMISIISPNGFVPDPKDFNQTTNVFREGMKQFPDLFKRNILHDMRRVGYELTDIGVAAPTTIQVQGAQGEVLTLFARENGIAAAIDQFAMSVGMFRALAIIIHLNYGLFSRGAGCVLIDDIGEGLDFDRSSSLIKLIIEKVKSSEIQIIMTTNDRYVMNGVDLEYWTVLSRKGQEVHALNAKNRPNEFDEFKFTGLSNFDFLARDFLSGDSV